MKYTRILFFLIILIFSCTACGTIKAIQVNYNIQNLPDEKVSRTINNYFHNFNDIRKWKDYATDSFIMRAYSWCTGDYTEQATIDEMVQKYYEVNIFSLNLISVEINSIEVNENNELLIEVVRTWENNQTDETIYVILLEDIEWKFDNRI